MGRVERRMYRRRQKRAQVRRLLLLAGLLVIGAGLLIRSGATQELLAERITSPSPTPVTAAFDETVETREVTLPAENWYAIQTGVFSAEESAAQKANAYSDRGAPGTVIQDGAKWRVFIACYGSESDASAVRTRLGESQRVETYLYTWSCPELRLRLTGMAGQLDVVEAGLSLLMQTAAQLRDTATLLDAGQLTTAEAHEAVVSMNDRLNLWAGTAKERFGKTLPNLINQMLTVTDGWAARKKTLDQAADSATNLSAALKGQGMSLYDELVRLRASISTTP